MGMRTLLNRTYGLTDPFQRRPSRLSFMGVNQDSPQCAGLVCTFPMWEPPGVACFNVMPTAMVGQPFNVLSGYDQDFGDVYIGDGIGSGGQTDPSRGYKFLSAEIRPYIDFGVGTARPFSLAFWFRSLTVAPATDMYLITFDDPLAAFSGFAVILDPSNQMACTTGNNQTVDQGFKTVFNPYDGKWHHFVFTHQPSGNPAAVLAINTYYIDGRFDGQSNACADIGPCANNLYIGVDDDGLSQAFGGAFCDFRIYNRKLLLYDAQRMYHQDTRWELYSPKRAVWELTVPGLAPIPRRLVNINQAVPRASSF